MESKEDNCKVKYLVLEKDRVKVVSADKLRAWLAHTSGEIRVFRLCGTNDPKELFLRWFGNGYLICDRYGNNEGV